MNFFLAPLDQIRHCWWWLFFRHPDQFRAQSWGEHWSVAFFTSARLVLAGFVGMVHAFIPAVAPAYTSQRVIRCYRQLTESGRHEDEIENELYALEGEN